MKLNQAGEFGLIEKLKRSIPKGTGVKRGIGDDAAVVTLDSKCEGLLTTDMLIEGVHFNKSDAPERIGNKVISASLSDIAAMGGTPKYALVSLGVDPQDSLERIKAIYQGMISRASKYNTYIVGGDTVSSGQLVINVALYGEVPAGRSIGRNGARSGDSIYVSGPLGNSFKSGHHLVFEPRLKESAYLVKNYRPTSMIDISDGLVADLGHIITVSKSGARIYQAEIPLRKGARLSNALYDGEDFELLFTIPKSDDKRLCQNKKFRFYKIGQIINAKGIVLLEGNRKIKLEHSRGYRHF
jgi:thiamine-monophosphate kinase